MIFFDVDETLLDFKSAEYWAVMKFYNEYGERFAFNKDEFYDKWCSIGKIHFHRYLAGELTFREQKIERIKGIFDLVDVHLNDSIAEEYFQIYLESFEDNWKAFDDVVPCLESLKGCRLGIISNGDPGQQKLKLEKSGILHYFEVIVTAGEAGAAKPDSKIYHTACKKAGLEPHECLYVGDQVSTDILPCIKMGMRGIWLNRWNETAEYSCISEIRSLTQLKDLLT